MAARKKKSAQDQVFDELSGSRRDPNDPEQAKPEEIAADDGVGGGEPDPAPQEDPAAEPALEELPQRTGTRYLRHELTEEDVSSLRAERESGDAEIEEHATKLRAAEAEVKSLKKVIDGLEEEGRKISKTIRAGWEYRNIECTEREAPRVGGDAEILGIGTYRQDTDEQIEWRELSASERQGRLFS